MDSPTAEKLEYQAQLARLYSRIDYERTATVPDGMQGLKLERMRQLMARLGHPERELKIVHVAGTKGKGSTALMIGTILTSAGIKTGVYTSPHLERLEERIAIDGEICTPRQFIELMEMVWPAVESLDRDTDALGLSGGATFFEINTAMALLHFARQRAGAVVLEVGLGGRLDSTNICLPAISVITTISFDHTRQLGNTLELIAAEKAGIIKPGRPVVSGVVPAGPRDVIQAIARERRCELFQVGEHFGQVPVREIADRHPPALECPRFDYWERIADVGPEAPVDVEFKDVRVGILGSHQAANAAVAVATVRRLRAQGWEVSDDAIRQGLAGVRCPARVEVIRQDPTVIIDVAHNVASAEALAGTLAEHFPDARRRLLLFASSRDKDAAGMLRILLPQFQTVILTRFQNNPRASTPQELESVAERLAAKRVSPGPNARTLLAETPAEAWRLAESLLPEHDLACVTGSFFFAAEMTPLIRGQTR